MNNAYYIKYRTFYTNETYTVRQKAPSIDLALDYFMRNARYERRDIDEILEVRKIDTDFYISGDIDDELFKDCYEDLDGVCYAAARIYAFSDCETEGVNIDRISTDKGDIQYVGWLPGMRYRFVNGNGDIVWDRSFPEWDH